MSAGEVTGLSQGESRGGAATLMPIRSHTEEFWKTNKQSNKINNSIHYS
jgi:hypothetical protein